MNEFVFGSLATSEKRTAYLEASMRGVRHHHRRQPHAPQAGQSTTLTVTVELPQVVERVECVLSEPETAVYPLTHVSTDWDLLNWSYYQVWQVTLPPQAQGSIVRYQIKAHLRDGGDPILADDGTTFSYFVDDHEPPQWAQAAVVYQIFPDRFYPGNGRSWADTDDLNQIHGGTLRGILEKLDYISAMGFNCLWLNPFFPDDSHHGYHATDYFSVNPRLGTMADIQELVAECHRRDIRLMLDFVANHWSNEHATFLAAQADKNSPYYDWYRWIAWPDEYETFFGVKELPQLNTNHPAVRAHLLKSARFWLGEIGFDGLRLDYVLGPDHDFWTDLRAAVKQIKPDVWLFGEAVDTPEMQMSYEGVFDGTLDFILADALRKTFAFGTMDIVAFDAFLHQHEIYFPNSFSHPLFLDNHDMSRFLWLVDGNKQKLKLAALCQFTLSGTPIVYNGSEVGVSQVRDIGDPNGYGMAEYRQPMAWGAAQDGELRDYFRWLIHLRRDHPVLWRGGRQTLHVDGRSQTYVYLRHDDQEQILVGLNLGDQPQTITVNVNGRSHTLTLPAQEGTAVVVV